ncbi:MAG: insulinase family protein [Deltaproteobacteria bacterium]|nr:MAG: insulinase family protein [Deltaproteobacteria bacterium]
MAARLREPRRLRHGALTLLYDPVPGPLTAIALVVRAGSRFDGAHPGIAHMAEHMLFQGTRRFDQATLNRRAGELGGEHDADTGYEDITLHFEVFNDDVEEALTLLAEQCFRSTVPADRFHRTALQPREHGGRRRRRGLARHGAPRLPPDLSQPQPPSSSPAPSHPQRCHRARPAPPRRLPASLSGPSHGHAAHASGRARALDGGRDRGCRSRRAALPGDPRALGPRLRPERQRRAGIGLGSGHHLGERGARR